MRRFLAPAGVTPAHIADVQLVGAMASLIDAEFGVGVLPSWTIGPEVRAGRIIPLRLGRTGMFRTWSAATRRTKKRDQSLHDFIVALSTGAPASGFRLNG